MKDNTAILIILGLTLSLMLVERVDTKDISKRVINIEKIITLKKGQNGFTVHDDKKRKVVAIEEIK